MPGFLLPIGLVVAAFCTFVAFSKDDEKPPDPNSSSRSSSSTRTQWSDQPPPYTSAHKQASTRAPATTIDDHFPHHSGHASPHVRDSRQKPMASARTSASNQFSPSDRVLGTQPAGRTPVLTCLSGLESDESQNEDVGDITAAEELRKRARHHGSEAFEARKLARDARRKQDYQAERKYINEATTHENAKEALNAKAATIIFREKNKGREECMVDLHGLYVPEAIQYVKQSLLLASLRDYGEVRFIVGKGLHCDGGAKIRPALEELCVERGLTHSLDPYNTGVLIVQVG